MAFVQGWARPKNNWWLRCVTPPVSSMPYFKGGDADLEVHFNKAGSKTALIQIWKNGFFSNWGVLVGCRL